MTAKGVWGWTIGGLMALGGLIGAPLSDSLVKEGKLPDWISPKLAAIVGWFSTDVPIPVWMLVLGLIGIGVAGTLFVKFQPRSKPSIFDSVAATIHQANTNRRCMELEEGSAQLRESYVLLQLQLQEKTQALAALEAQKALEREEVQVSTIGLRVLEAVSRSRGDRPTLSSIAGIISVDHVEAYAAIDVLVQQKLLEKVSVAGGHSMYFRFTVEGRDYYEQRKDL